MILESIVTTVSAEGEVNIAPMGPVVDGRQLTSGSDQVSFTLRPFNSSRTYSNLSVSRQAVIHVTDDADLFARAAVDGIVRSEVPDLVQQIPGTNWWPLKDCYRWFAVEVVEVSDEKPRVDMQCRVVRSEIVRPFFGFNRAKHAVIEAAILATRTHLIEATEIRSELDRLQPLIDKTGGDSERRAFQFLRVQIDSRLDRTK
ncbi:MAG: DUF447 domain-containing protein [Rubripirellula sp.]